MSGALADLANVPHQSLGAPASIVVVAKCPIPGSSKTRLIPTLGAEGAAMLAEAMLADVLTSVSQCKELATAEKVLLFAPPGDEGRDRMLKILRDNGIVGRWVLQPIRNKNHDLQSSQLSHILQEALRIQRRHTKPEGPVVFLGMDSPEVPLNELIAACFHTGPNEALICPAADGGYGLLSVPGCANPRACFNNVQWSHPLTALSQIKALTDQGISVSLGPIMHDIDDGDDLEELCWRLRDKERSKDIASVLSHPSQPAAKLAKHRSDNNITDDDDDNNDDQTYSCASSSPSTTSWFNMTPLSAPVTPSPKKASTRHVSCAHTRKALIALKKLKDPAVVARKKSPPRRDKEEETEREMGTPVSTYPTCGETPTIGTTLLDDLKAVWSFS